MKRKIYGNRILALALTGAMTLSSFASMGTALVSEAASSIETGESLLVNGDFESETAFSPANGTDHSGNWHEWNSAGKTTEEVHNGSTAVKFSGNECSLEQDVSGLYPGVTYVFTVWAKVSGTSEHEHLVGVKNHGTGQQQIQVTSTEWTKYEIEFQSTNGKARLFGWVDQHDGVDMYMDDVTLKAKYYDALSIENGKLNIDFSENYTGSLEGTDISATYFTSADTTPKALNLTKQSSNETTKALVMSFDEVAALPADQTVTVDVTIGSETIRLDYVVAASGEEEVKAAMTGVEAANGSVVVTLDQAPSFNPTAEDFTLSYKSGDGEYQNLKSTGFSYDKENHTVTISFAAFRGISSGAQTITVKVGYNDVEKEGSFEVEQGTSYTYYVSADGSDENDGLSEEKPLKTIEKLNTMTFAPGDQILFKKGDTFTGCFKPQGSGAENAPIVIGAYGDETAAKPVLMPGDDWQVDYIMSANAMVTNVKVNYVIQFYNVEYWEVRGLEIMDPDAEEYLDPTSDQYIGNSANDVYRSGITIQAEDIGELEHFIIDDVVIHGFHGPGTNIGKTSGGITMNVITNKERNRSNSTPTQINGIQVTNCEIYDVGRTGINFLTPWSFRTDEKWGPFDYGTSGYDYLPYEDFYMANNYIHDVDGDGTIVDNCSKAIVEKNLVTRCALRPATTGGGAAVGLFNWNSDDTIFRFNEVYDIRPGAGSTACNDSQGIEIDALNDRTWVEYNYVHDNYGGFMMLCNIGDNYRSYDGVIRYNISQNDYAHPRQGLFDLYFANYGTKIYNNTFYLTERALEPGSDEIFLFSAASVPNAQETMKFYNNIFYYDGATPAAANKFADSAIDWQSNIFYGFTNLPENDNADQPNISADPLLAHPGNGGTGTKPGEMPDLTCYSLRTGSPAIGTGVNIADNGERDFLGNKLDTDKTDIGAVKYTENTCDHTNMKFVDAVAATCTEAGLKAHYECDDCSHLYVKAEDDTYTEVSLADLKEAAKGHDWSEWTKVEGKREEERVCNNEGCGVKETRALVSDEISLEGVIATDGNHQTGSDTEGPASFVIDGNEKTLWHTNWEPADDAGYADHWIQLELPKTYEVDGFKYLPRQSGTNGRILGYEIQVSVDGTNFTTVASGEWEADAEQKVVAFEPVAAKYVRLVSTNAQSDQAKKQFSSAAEVRVTGKEFVEISFADVQDSKAFYYTPVYWAAGKGVTTGRVDGTFDAKGNVTRGEMVTFLWRLAGSPDVSVENLKFTDVGSDSYYAKAIAWAVAEGIAQGTSAATFEPKAEVTRAQAVTFLYRYAGGSEVTTDKTFPDVPASKYYYKAVSWAAENEITGGRSNGTFDPLASCNRGEAVTFLYRTENLK